MRSYLGFAFSLLLVGCASDSMRDGSSKLPDIRLHYDDHGRLPGCSWYCAAPPITVTASSTLRDGIYSYEPANIHDCRKSTVWAEGDSDSGIGTTITFTFDFTGERYRNRKGKPIGINRISLINGFARTPELWAANGRVKTFKVTFNGAPKGTFTVQDTASHQNVKLPDLTFPFGRKSQLVLEITDVYPGTTHEDTCIADIMFDGFGDH
jgi:hypothetical protein